MEALHPGARHLLCACACRAGVCRVLVSRRCLLRGPRSQLVPGSRSHLAAGAHLVGTAPAFSRGVCLKN